MIGVGAVFIMVDVYYKRQNTFVEALVLFRLLLQAEDLNYHIKESWQDDLSLENRKFADFQKLLDLDLENH
jgi:hypothetical protein